MLVWYSIRGMSAKKEADGKPAAVHPRRQTHDRRLSHIVGHPLDAVSLRLDIGDDAASLPARSAATDSSAVSQYQHGGDSPQRQPLALALQDDGLSRIIMSRPLPPEVRRRPRGRSPSRQHPVPRYLHTRPIRHQIAPIFRKTVRCWCWCR